MTTTNRMIDHIRHVLFSVLLAMAVVSPASAGETITFFHNDIAGSPMLATDVNGMVAWKETYRPYGDRVIEDPASMNNELWFTGKPHDETTGLTYMSARYYDLVIGRFMAIDPAAVDPGDPHSINRYAYANNNPYKFVDPDGRNATAAFGGVLYEIGQFVQGNGFDGRSIMGALADGYNGEGSGFAAALGQDSLNFVPAGTAVKAVRAVGGAVKTARVAKIGAASGGAQSAANGLRLQKQLGSAEQLADLASGGGKAISGAGTKTPLRDVSRLVDQYGGSASNWAKVTSGSRVAADGTQFEIHAYRNVATGQLVQAKTKVWP